MKLELKEIPDSFGISLLVSGFLPILFSLYYNLTWSFLMGSIPELPPWSFEPERLSLGFDNIKCVYSQGILLLNHLEQKYKDLGYLLVLFYFILLLVFAVISHSLRIWSERILSGNLPLIWKIGVSYQRWVKARIDRNVFEYLDPFGWIINKELGNFKRRSKPLKVACLRQPYFLYWVKRFRKNPGIAKSKLRRPLKLLSDSIRSDPERFSPLRDQFKNLIFPQGCNVEEIKDQWERVKIGVEIQRDARYGMAFHDFPADGCIMPTRYSNILEKADLHAERCHGVNPEYVWPHLSELMSQKYQKALTDSRYALESISQIAITALLSNLAWGWYILRNGANINNTIIFGCSMFFYYILYCSAINSARGYTRALIGAYDLYLPELQEKLVYLSAIESTRVFWKGAGTVLAGAQGKPASKNASPSPDR
ncbi:hypothetical protein KP005_17955 [Geomonas nitrogeniifigens]|uniref:Uncharacterized protein n=1 Tax=Geomonas diazotrophica TaxID=2843197 RepID=A0ABX8JI59_9BACT|nr:hypothetical protein [Geomonas nitrogeniifigens]QWV97202.1 hypothetical protein KP005_17955 [Geomonas nitrogeniifigens]